MSRRRLVRLGQQTLVEDFKVVHVTPVGVLGHDPERLPVEVSLELELHDAHP